MGGLAVWSATEYATHRWAFHGRLSSTAVASEHQIHHADPLATDARMRALGVAAAGTVAALGSRFVPRTTALGWWLGYVAYDQLHWRAHHRRGPSAYERRLATRHRAHHERGGNYGVTTSWLDGVLNTETQVSG